MAIDLNLDWNEAFAEPKREMEGKMTIADALVLSLRDRGRIDFGYIEELSGASKNEAIGELGDAIFLDPESMEWVTADEYLSGNLARKLRTAIDMQDSKGGFTRNIEALKSAIPPRIPAGGIYISLGSPWIPTDVIEQFILHLMSTQLVVCRVAHDPFTGTWHIKDKNNMKKRAHSYAIWGTGRMPALEILEASLNVRNAVVYDEVEDMLARKKKRFVNHGETMSALEKQRKMNEEFRRWAWEDPSRRERLVNLYNERFCGFRARRFDGSFLAFPGMAEGAELRPHQKDAVTRILFQPNTLLAHDVGSGKTYVCAAAGIELKRMGLSKKNLYVVPNSLVAQWGEIFQSLYPQADILVVHPKDFVPAKRQSVLADIRDNDRDAVIMAYSSFDLIPLSRKHLLEALDEKIRSLDEALADAERATEGAKRTRTLAVKKREKLVEAAMEELDRGITFDELGITRLFVDEAHNYKNIPLGTSMGRVSGVSSSSSKKCEHMLAAVRCVQRANGGSGAVFATGTPISNSLGDLFALQSYLQGAVLSVLDVGNFDAWCGMFAQKETCFEIDVDTNGFKLATRLSKFGNLGTLSSLLAEIADFHHLDSHDGIPACEVIDVVVPKTERFTLFLDDVSARADRVRGGFVSAKDDNLLKICTDGRKAALDIRLFDSEAPFDKRSKVWECARNVYGIYRETSTGRGAQLVFCDTGTPKDGFNIYSELKRLLAEFGIPADEIAFVHDAKSAGARTKLFKAVRAGKIRVLVGSTPKLGLGVNVQERLAAAHHLDIPWRPSDMEQRNGRIVREGNIEYPDVRIFRYVTEGSFDAYSWQLLENKQQVIDTLLGGTYSGEKMVGDIGSTALDYGEIKALSVGNPLLKERVEVANRLSRAKILHRKAVVAHASLISERERIPGKIEKLERIARAIKSDATFIACDPAPATKEKREFIAWQVYHTVPLYAFRQDDTHTGSNYRGFNVVIPANLDPEKPFVWLTRSMRYRVDLADMKERGIAARFDHVLNGLENRLDETKKRIEDLYSEWEAIDRELAGSVDTYEREIRECEDQLSRIDLKLEEG